MTSLSFKPRVPVFDANVKVGDAHDEVSPCPDRAGLLAEMDTHSIQRAVIYHALADKTSPVDANRALEDWLGEDGRLYPQWAALPTRRSLEQLRGLHAQGRVSSVRLAGLDSVKFPFRPWSYDPLLSWLSQEGIPLWLALPEMDAHELVSTLQAYPDLETVLVGAHYMHALWAQPMMKALPRAHLELSRFEPIGQLEDLLDEFGASRFVFGSWYWRLAMGPMLFYLHHVGLSDDDLALICEGNLVRILGEQAND
jgi:hypothetical protein